MSLRKPLQALRQLVTGGENQLTSAAVLHPNADVTSVDSTGHLDAKIVNRRGLRYLPVNAVQGHRARDLAHVDDQAAN